MARDLVIGLGTAGSLIVQRLLADTSDRAVRGVDFDDNFTKLKEDPEVLAAVGSGRLELLKGDATDEASMRRAFEGVTGAAFFAFQGKSWRSAGKVDHNGVNTAAQAAAAAGVKRVLLISSLFVSERHGRNPLRIMLNTVRWRMMDNKLLGEQKVRICGVPYTIIRPGRFVDKVKGASVKLVSGQGDSISGSICPEDVAAICVAVVQDSSLEGVTFEVIDEWAMGPEVSKGGAPEIKSEEEVAEAEDEGDVAYPSIGPPDRVDSVRAVDEDSDDGIVAYPSIGDPTAGSSSGISCGNSGGNSGAARMEKQFHNIFLGLHSDAALVAFEKVSELSLQS